MTRPLPLLLAIASGLSDGPGAPARRPLPLAAGARPARLAGGRGLGGARPGSSSPSTRAPRGAPRLRAGVRRRGSPTSSRPIHWVSHAMTSFGGLPALARGRGAHAPRGLHGGPLGRCARGGLVAAAPARLAALGAAPVRLGGLRAAPELQPLRLPLGEPGLHAGAHPADRAARRGDRRLRHRRAGGLRQRVAWPRRSAAVRAGLAGARRARPGGWAPAAPASVALAAASARRASRRVRGEIAARRPA